MSHLPAPSPNHSPLTDMVPSSSNQTAPHLLQHRARPQTTSSSRPPMPYALLIAIDNYPRLRKLKGAIADLDAVYDFLTNKMRGNPEDRIKCLKDGDATRDAIIEHIRALGQNSTIKRDDPIIVFFAGHGAEVDPPAGWPAGRFSKVQMLCPYDFHPSTAGNTPDTKVIQGIPDRTLGALLNLISGTKGDNIAVIFDCCFSGSGTRQDDEPEDSTSLIRGVDLPKDYAISPKLDQDIWSQVRDTADGARCSRPAGNHEDSSWQSHVLLAACMENERSRERDGRGLFTVALLQTLDRPGWECFTYENLVKSLPPIPDQNPHCEGFHATRHLFRTTTTVAPSNPGPFLITRQTEAPRPPETEHSTACSTLNFAIGKWKRTEPNPVQLAMVRYNLSVGFSYGIAKGALFTYYADEELSPQAKLGTLTAVQVEAYKSVLECNNGSLSYLDAQRSPQTAYARLTSRTTDDRFRRWWIAEEDVALRGLFLQAVEDVQRERDGEWKGLPILSDTSPVVTISSLKVKGRVTFEIHDETCLKYGLKEMHGATIPCDVARLSDVISSASHFFFYLHLNCHITKSPTVSNGRVRLECTELELESLDENLSHWVYKPKEGNKIKGNLMELYVGEDDSEKKLYGYKVVNDTVMPLYAALFYFDMSDLSIVRYYSPTISGGSNTAYSIPASGGELTIGYGSGGIPPYRYLLRPGQDVDVGILKLFLFNKTYPQVNIEQTSPFLEGSRLSGTRTETQDLHFWDSIDVYVIQRRMCANNLKERISGCLPF
ncbi:uncharacterized protein STEHIDRAFT_156937 [Stereum hirsutum FP-91666 SS1]|uniref:uncharacterized protein n=1 Tax=Stereum hirsutum (strain FP-91666) TaxID=721885 RepID=UPI000441036B|nr:uncharacterized protein STEHIDRAFT_156937 [Stereum hirsutum FP-91666 SS1]EIM86633.1 hypothetical protein STEHIDRAFT_156937 [Stereum hirsutum FP-91666 SS1]